jgi:hypothetical protein
MAGPFGHGPIEGLGEEPELAVPPDHGGVQASGVGLGAGGDGDEAVRGDAPGLPLEVELAGRLDLDGVADQAVGRLADQDLAGSGALLQPRRGVHGVPRDEPLAGGGIPWDHLTGGDAGSNGQGDAALGLEVRVQPVEGMLHFAGSPEGPDGIVLVQLEDAEHGHDGVPDVLLDHPTVAFHDPLHGSEEATHDPAEGLGVEPLPQGGGSGHVREQDGDDLASFPGRGGFRQGGSAGLAEASAVRVLLPTVGTDPHRGD